MVKQSLNVSGYNSFSTSSLSTVSVNNTSYAGSYGSVSKNIVVDYNMDMNNDFQTWYNSLGKVGQKLVQNTAFYGTTLIVSLLMYAIDENFEKTLGGILVTSITSAIFKGVSGFDFSKTGKNLISGGIKALTKPMAKDVSSESLQGSIDASLNKFYNSKEILGSKGLFKPITVGTLSADYGVDFIATTISSFVSNLYIEDGDASAALVDTFNSTGSNLFSSAWKVSLGAAGSVIGQAIGGGAGSKIGKSIGTIAGATVSNWAENALFEGEQGWLTAAGVATIAGSAALGTFAVMSLGIATIGAAFAVGGLVVIGAAAGTVIVWGIKKIVDYVSDDG